METPDQWGILNHWGNLDQWGAPNKWETWNQWRPQMTRGTNWGPFPICQQCSEQGAVGSSHWGEAGMRQHPVLPSQIPLEKQHGVGLAVKMVSSQKSYRCHFYMMINSLVIARA